jgi:bifunctional DNA-binding transcriptional regulator/antitoxin component of YhaV-PrlF toxin-antitoxin module
MKHYLELGKNGQLILPPSVCRQAELEEGIILKAVVDEDGSIHLVRLTIEERNRGDESQLKDIKWAQDPHDYHK